MSRRTCRAAAVLTSMAMVGVACGGGGFALEVGDCVRVPTAGATADGSAEVTIVGCDEEHQLEVFHVFELRGDPSDPDAVIAEVGERCLGPAWTAYLGVPASGSPLELLPIPPVDPDRARDVACTVREPGGATRIGSLRAAATTDGNAADEPAPSRS